MIGVATQVAAPAAFAPPCVGRREGHQMFHDGTIPVPVNLRWSPTHLVLAALTAPAIGCIDGARMGGTAFQLVALPVSQRQIVKSLALPVLAEREHMIDGAGSRPLAQVCHDGQRTQVTASAIARIHGLT